MTDSTYFADNAEDSAELFRLQELERQLDPMSRQAFDDLGLAAGHSVLEIGPGAGSMLKWVASRVGSRGRVAGLDLNPRFVRDLTEPNISISEGDMMVDTLPTGPFDFIYARLVLMHVPDAGTAIRRLLEPLKPGGALLLVDLDFATYHGANPNHPKTADFKAIVDVYADVLCDKNVMDLGFGRSLPALMEMAGCIDVKATGTVWTERGGTPNAAFWKQSARTTHAAVSGLAPERTDLNLEANIGVYDDPDFWFNSPTFVVASGRKPAS